MTAFLTLEQIDVAGKTVLVRTDLNVPMQGGSVTDNTRIVRSLPTLEYLMSKNAKIVLLSHFGRPKGKFVPSMSMAPLVDELSEVLGGKEVKFGVDCVGKSAREAVDGLKNGEILLLENLRFHEEEEAGDDAFAKELASLGDVFINDAFSASHRAHASVTGIPKYLPTAAGRLMQQELTVLAEMFGGKESPIGAVIGGSKVSTKLDLLTNLIKTMDVLAIGGAMANTFLAALGHEVGKSLHEAGMKDTALAILKDAKKNGCNLVLPVDLVVAPRFEAHAQCRIVDVHAIPADYTAVDVGPASVNAYFDALRDCKIIVWNGPLGAFETSPYDASTIQLARFVAKTTEKGTIKSVAGGGDTVSALTHAGVGHSFSYMSTAGGAFLEWLEGKDLPGVAALATSPNKKTINA